MRQTGFFFKIFIIGSLLLSTVFLNATVIESISGESGDRSWENVNIWVGGVVPGAADTVIINGLVTVYTPVPGTFTACAKLTVNSGAILRDYWAGELHVNGELINNGTIENSYDGTYHLFLKVSGNVTNNGVWKNAVTTLNGSGIQHLSGSGNYCGNIVSENTADTLIASSDLFFNEASIDFTSDMFLLNAKKISIGNGYIKNANIVGENGELHMSGSWYDGAYSHSTCLINSTLDDDISLTGIVAVNSDVVFIGTVTVTDTLQNDFYNDYTLNIQGDIINNGLIRDANSSYSFFLNVDGNLTNNGEWTNHTTNLSGSNVQHLMFTSVFSGTNFNDTDSSSSVIADSDLHFHNCYMDLDSAELDLQGYQLSFTADWDANPDLRNALIIANGGSLFMNNYAYLNQSVLDGITLRGEVQVREVTFRGTITVEDTLENEYRGSEPITVDGSIINNGVIRNFPNDSHLVFNVSGNITNNGVWTNHTTNLSGYNAQHLLFTSVFSGTNFNDTDSSSSVIADSDLHFHNCHMDLDSAELDLQGYQLSFTGDYYTYDLKNALIIANGGSLFMNNYAYLYQTILNGITLRGEVQINNGVIFQGVTTVEDTLQNYYYSGYAVNVLGNIINNGLIRDYYNPLTINITGNMTNNGAWTNSLTELKGDAKQHVIINDNHAISGRLDLNAMLSGDTYQWLLDDAEITDATSQSLTFYTVGEPEFGHYVCKVTSSGEEALNSRMIRISNGSPEFSTLPDTGFAEDHFLKLPISFLFDYVEDPNDADLSLAWTITDNDKVITEIVADTINFSSELNWFGRDTLSVIASDGELSDTTNLIVVVEPVNDAPVITALADTSMIEDDSLKLALTAFDVDSDSLIFMATCDTSAIELALAENYLTLIPIVDWNGCAQIQVIVNDTELSDTTEFILIVNAFNDPPAAFSLISPLDSTLNSTDTVMVFQWEASTDADKDSLIYTLHLEGGDFEYVFHTDTNYVNLNVLDVEIPFDVDVHWTVYVFDGTDTTWSNETWQFSVSREVGIKLGKSLPHSYALQQSYPNPFNPITTIQYIIPKTSQVTLAIFNMRGQLIEKLVDQKQGPGYYSVQWNASRFSSGVYFYRIQADGFQQVKKCLLVK